MRRLMLLLVLGALVSAAVPARAATASSCGGLAPLELTCETSLTPSGPAVGIEVATDPTFVGLIEVRVVQGAFAVTLECIQASVATSSCVGEVTGLTAGRAATITGDVLTINDVVGGLPVDDLTPSIGTWTVTATG